MQLFHNGLLRQGPRTSPLLEAPRGAAKRAPKAIVDSFVKPVVGEVDDVRFTHAYTQPPNEIIRPILTRRSLVVYPLRSIAQQVVMAHPDDKAARPKEWSTWRFEVVLAVDDPTVTGADPPPDAPPPVTFDHNDWAPPAGAPWRCRHCYANRFQTMCFGQNDTTTPSSSGDGTTDLALTYCQHCGKSMEEAGWSIWLNFDQLPGGFQATLTNRHGPKMLALLRTKWPRAASPTPTPTSARTCHRCSSQSSEKGVAFVLAFSVLNLRYVGKIEKALSPRRKAADLHAFIVWPDPLKKKPRSSVQGLLCRRATSLHGSKRSPDYFQQVVSPS